MQAADAILEAESIVSTLYNNYQAYRRFMAHFGRPAMSFDAWLEHSDEQA